MSIRRLLSFRGASDHAKERARLGAAGSALRFFDEMAVATFVLDREHRVIVWNKACARLTGLEATAVIGTKDHWKGFYPQPRPCLADFALSGDAGGVDAQYAGRQRQSGGGASLSAENWCDLPNGKRLYLAIDASPVHDRTGAVVAVVETLQDFTAIEATAAAREADDKRAKEQAEALATERAGVVASIGEGLAKLAAQDLTFRIRGQMPAAYERLQANFNSAIDRLTSVVEAAVESSHALRVGTSQLSAAADDFSRRTEQQASNLEETTSAFSEIAGAVRRTADVSKQARNVAAATRSASQQGAETVRNAIDAMRRTRSARKPFRCRRRARPPYAPGSKRSQSGP
jgi:methyl-accepting chemotaxis protein